MKTDDLIELLAQDTPVRLRLGRVMTLALAAGTVASALLLVATVGLRHDMLSVFETARVFFKICATLLLALLASRLVFLIGRPGVPWQAAALTLLLLAAAVVAAVLLELFAVPAQGWMPALVGRHAAFCVFFIPVLAVSPLAGFLFALRNGAPDDPGQAGTVAGFAAGAIAAAIYAWHCPDDSPLFVAVWYTAGIAAVTACGFLIGRRFLRW
ncbi:MAG TPA: DUF1109 domain-containing protein [Shinella sp.]|uniref:DUF1109 domain-containing protein n=1 Tax=Shinella sp. TaxID=1870904 RepID=UPI0029B703B5|nr:DUF1109 domain-containing protein [Shinella sp.]MDX3978500.1 DUF1109 domain-containing protein [Shinella sp.]HEV7247596.1 DUF1109 domain-containing protein [Shinella sp.]